VLVYSWTPAALSGEVAAQALDALAAVQNAADGGAGVDDADHGVVDTGRLGEGEHGEVPDRSRENSAVYASVAVLPCRVTTWFRLLPTTGPVEVLWPVSVNVKGSGRCAIHGATAVTRVTTTN
jgi:hypothetical protein